MTDYEDGNGLYQFDDEWDNLGFDTVFRQMLLKRLDKQNELLERIVKVMEYRWG